MRCTKYRCLLACGWALLAFTHSAQADEEKVALKDVPRAVLDRVQHRYPDAKVTGAEKETEHGKTVYEIAIDNEGQKMELTLTAEGNLTEIEKQIPSRRLPKVVSAALESKYPNATYKQVEEVIKVKNGDEKLEYYEVLLVADGNRRLEVSVTPEGKLHKEEDKSKEKD